MSHKLIRKQHFNLTTAENDVWYELWTLEKGWFGRTRYKPMYQYHPMGMRRIAHGDLSWAKKIAKQYNIPVPIERKG